MSSEKPKASHPSMHFPLVASNGGPFDDASFIAGWNMATLDCRLAAAALNDLYMGGVVLSGDLFPQIDLIAMRHGLVVEAEPLEDDPDYAVFYFVRPRREIN